MSTNRQYSSSEPGSGSQANDNRTNADVNRTRSSTRRVLVEDDRASQNRARRDSRSSRSRQAAEERQRENLVRDSARSSSARSSSSASRSGSTARGGSASRDARSSRTRSDAATSSSTSRDGSTARRSSDPRTPRSARDARGTSGSRSRNRTGASGYPYSSQAGGVSTMRPPLDRRFLVIAAIAAVLLIVLVAIGCSAIQQSQAERRAEAERLAASEAAIAAAELEPKTVTFLAVGDIVAHDEMINQSRDLNGRAYDFNHVFEPMLSRLAPYDLTSVTQETPLVSDESQVGGYPVFGTPVEMGDAIVNAGFDIVTSATNHSMDQGIDGVFHTIDYWKQNHPEIVLMGLHDSAEAADGVSFIERNGIKIAMTDLTYDLNGFILPDGQEYAVDMLSELDAICKNVEAAQDEADFTICYVHMGDEYATEPSDEQREVAARLIDAGADVVLGSHVHVVQPMEEVTTAVGNKGLVYYSLGNYASNQADVENMLGGAAVLTITKTPDPDGGAETKVTEHSFVPVFCHYDYETTKMYFLDDYTDELANSHFITLYGNPFTVDQVYGIWKDITGLSR